jgi:hypothetical protein
MVYISGDPDPKAISTPCAQRQNITMRNVDLNRLRKEEWEAVSRLSKIGAPEKWYVVLLKRAP